MHKKSHSFVLSLTVPLPIHCKAFIPHKTFILNFVLPAYLSTVMGESRSAILHRGGELTGHQGHAVQINIT